MGACDALAQQVTIPSKETTLQAQIVVSKFHASPKSKAEENPAPLFASKASSSCLAEANKNSQAVPEKIIVEESKVSRNNVQCGRLQKKGFHIPTNTLSSSPRKKESDSALPPIRVIKRKVTPTAKERKLWGMNNRINISTVVDSNQSALLSSARLKERDIVGNVSQGEIPREYVVNNKGDTERKQLILVENNNSREEKSGEVGFVKEVAGENKI